MMRRLCTILPILLIINIVTAAPVSVDKAAAVAAGLFGRNTQKSTSIVVLKHVGVFNGDTVYYVFTYADGGFAIISADDAVNPVLGFSQTSPASEPIENKMLMHQLNRYGQKISEVRSQGIGSTANKRQWRARADSAPTADTAQAKTVGPLVTSAWSQTDAYNDSCPSFAGCVAVAMGQVMRYHKWPKTGRGWHKYVPSEAPEYGLQFANFGATTYRWDLMPDKIRAHNSTAERAAVAQLLYHAGVSVDMSYTKNGSGSYTIDVLYAMPQYFRYSDSIRLCTYSDYSNAQWFSMIMAEIDAGRPVIYSGATSGDEGHAWIVDGYNSDGYMHINWGWGGDYDGFFLPDRMILETTLFDRELDAVVGIKPSTEPPLMWTLQSSGFSRGYRGILNISAVNEQVAWASAYDGSISNGQCMDYCRTIDGGESWQAGTVNIPKNESYTISSISAVSAVEAWASIYVSVNSNTLTGGKIVHTADGGKTWNIQPTAVFDGKSAFPNAVHFWDSQSGVCIGDPNGGYFEIYTTTDGGKQWTRVRSSRIPASNRDETGIVGSFSVFDNTVFFGTSTGRLFRSVDRGATWTVVQTPLRTEFKLAFRDNDSGMISAVSAKNYAVYRTSDGGSNWEQIHPQGPFFVTSFAYMPGTDTLVSVGFNARGTFSGLSYSTDNGSSFTNYEDFYTDIDHFTALGISPNGKGMWAGALNYSEHYGGMWHRGALNVVRGLTAINQHNSVEQMPLIVYPNPATDLVTIESDQLITNVEIISASGKILGCWSVDSEQFRISVADLPRGIYMVKACLRNSQPRFGRVVVVR
jgi:photosystem II stability/assembly factor-like uncharacterized protein